MPSGSGRKPVSIPPFGLAGELHLPADPQGLVIFAHGSGSSRLSPRNRQVADRLCDTGFATLLFDLLTEEEAKDRRKVFDIDLLGGRLVAAVDWAHGQPEFDHLQIGLFGASTGAAAALTAAAMRPRLVRAVVSRGGRPDLAGAHLAGVTAPTQLIVGSEDHDVLGLNRQVLRVLRGPSQLRIVPMATHLFEEPGALDWVVRLATAWFQAHLGPGGRRRP